MLKDNQPKSIFSFFALQARVEQFLNWLTSIKVGVFLALRQIKRTSKWTTGLIVFIMMLAFLNLVVVSGLLVGLITGSFKQFRENYSGEVIITASAGRDYIENSPGLLAYIANHPQVTAYSPRYGLSAQILGTLTENPKPKERANKIGARLVGLDPAKEEVLTGFSRFIIKGENLRVGDSGYILLGSNLLKEYSSFADANIPGLDLLKGLDVGSKVRASVTSSSGEIISRDFIVKGILKSKVDEISARFFVLDTDLKTLMQNNKEQVQEIAIRTDYAFAPELVAELKTYMGNYSARIQTTDEAIPSFLRNIETTFKVLGNALSSIALIVASITVFIVIFINAVTKRKFIGIMKGIGITPTAIQFSYIFQALFYGLIGSGIGLFLTFGILKPFFDKNPIDFPFSDGILVVTPMGAFIRVMILLVITLLAGYLPAKLIIRKNTLDAILGR